MNIRFAVALLALGLVLGQASARKLKVQEDYAFFYFVRWVPYSSTAAQQHRARG